MEPTPESEGGLTDLPDLIDLTPNGLHQPFLEKAVEGDECGPEGMLAAFLTLRVVDQFAVASAQSEPTIYQIRATEEYLERLDPECRETRFLIDIVKAASEAVRLGDTGALLDPLVAFADWLTRDLKLAQALDVLNTGLRAFHGDDERPVLTLQLKRGPVLRQMGLFAESSEAYSIADHLATILDDVHHSLLAQIGQAVVLQRRGNLPDAGKLLSKVKDRARQVEDRDAEAKATHDLAVNYVFQGRYADGACLAFEAFGLYDEVHLRRLALSDLGSMLKSLGHYDAARDALEVVALQAPEFGTRANALLELLHVAGLRRDRVGFERYRKDLEAVVETLPPSGLVDFNLKMGIGLTAFELAEQAIPYLRAAVEQAEQHNLNRQLFEAEALLDATIKNMEKATAPAAFETTADAAAWDDSIDQVAQVLHELHAEPELVSTYPIPAGRWDSRRADQ